MFLNRLGICFCLCTCLASGHEACRPGAKTTWSTNPFQLLGSTLQSSARSSFQVLGVSQEPLQRKIAEALAQLPLERAVVVRGLDGLDEVTLSASTQVFFIDRGKDRVTAMAAGRLWTRVGRFERIVCGGTRGERRGNSKHSSWQRGCTSTNRPRQCCGWRLVGRSRTKPSTSHGTLQRCHRLGGCSRDPGKACRTKSIYLTKCFFNRGLFLDVDRFRILCVDGTDHRVARETSIRSVGLRLFAV